MLTLKIIWNINIGRVCLLCDNSLFHFESSLRAQGFQNLSVISEWREQDPFSVARENEGPVLVCFLKHSRKRTARIKSDNDTKEDGKNRRENKERSTENTHKNLNGLTVTWATIPWHHYSPRQWMNYLMNLTLPIIHPLPPEWITPTGSHTKMARQSSSVHCDNGTNKLFMGIQLAQYGKYF